MSATLDEKMMAAALEAGARGRPAPNPHVGAVVARGERIVAVGHHERRGEAHAEVMALARAGEQARGATLYCTLEPCNHHGRTGPCTEAILAAGITRVVIGCLDPATHGVPGAARLREAGLEVEVGVHREAAEELVEDFATLFHHGRPLVVLKAAVTLDGRIASRTGDSKWITGEAARSVGHALRARCDAVMVGAGTVVADDPRLDVRMTEGVHPLRVVVDGALRTPDDSNVIRLARAGVAATWIAHGPHASEARREALRGQGVELLEVGADARGRLDLSALLRALGARGVMRLLVEGGSKLHGALLDLGVVDRAEVFIAPLILGDAAALGLATRDEPPTRIADALRLDSPRVRVLEGGDVHVSGRLRGAR